MKLGCYARVSRHEQQTLPLQRDAMVTYAQQRGWTIVVMVEEVSSGARERLQRQELLRAARRRTINAIMVWRLDRWGRSVADLVGTLQELQALGVGFISLSEALDFTTPIGRAMAGLLAIFAEFERDILRERVKAGIAEARRRGTRHGRPPSVAHRTEDVQHLAAAGLSKSAIARRLAVSRTSVRRLLGTAMVSPQESMDAEGDQRVRGNLTLLVKSRPLDFQEHGRALLHTIATVSLPFHCWMQGGHPGVFELTNRVKFTVTVCRAVRLP